MPRGQKSDAHTGYDYENLQGMPHTQVSNSGFQSASALQDSRYIQRGSNPYTDYLHPELSMKNPVGGMRGQGPYHISGGPIEVGRKIGGKIHVGKALGKVGKALQKPAENIATGVATNYLMGALTNPAVDDALLEGAEVGMMAAAGRRRGRPPAGGKKGIGKAFKKVASHPITKTIVKKATPIVQKQGEKALKKGIESLVAGLTQDEEQEMSGGRKMSLKKIASHPITKKIADHVVKTATPIVKEHAKRMIKEALSGSSSAEPSGGKIKMGKIGKSIGKEVGKSALKVGTNVGEQMLANYLAGEGRHDKVRQAIDDIEDLGSDIAHLVRKKRRGGAQSGGARSERAAIVKQVMAERGCSLPQASKIVKEEGLYGGKIKMGKIGKSIGKEVGKSALRVGTDVGEQMLASYLAGEGRGGDPKHSPLGRFL